MELNGLQLPAALEQIVHDGQGEWTALTTKEGVKRERKDAYGNEFDRFDPEIYNLAEMIETTASLPRRCPPEGDQVLRILAGKPGLIPYVRDFSKIVAFAELLSGEPFCLDYRENDRDPEVILYQDGYWRRVAPNFAAFMELHEPSGRPGRKPLEVNGLPLPAALVRIIREARGEWTRWMMKEPDWRKRVNAYGDEYDCGGLEIYDYDRMVEETDELPGRFDPWSEEEYNEEAAQHPDVIPYLEEHSKIVVFGQVGSGEPHCLDYRENPRQPSVFYLPMYGVYFRRVAPTFDAFIELLVPHDDEEYDRRMAEEEAWDAEASRDLWDAEAAAERAALGPEELTAIAYREAGHMVAAVVLSLALMQASIKHPVNGLGRVSSSSADLSSWATAPPDQIKNEMVCGLAGLFARQLVDPSTDTSLALGPDEEGACRFLTPPLIGKRDEGAREERAQAFRAQAEALVQEHSAALQAVDDTVRHGLGLGAMALVDQWIGRLEEGVREAAGPVSAAEAQAYRDEARVQARALVQEHRAAVQAVAEALLRELVLDGEEVRALVDYARRGEASPDG